jgi:ankyrin repeat protein
MGALSAWNLLDRHADPNIADNNGRTPLHLAAHYGQREAAEVCPEPCPAHPPLPLDKLY